MTLFHDLSLVVPSLGVGAILVAAFGMPHAYRKGRERTEEENRVYEGVTLAREHKPLAIAAEPWPVAQTRRDFDQLRADLPVQFGTRAEHERRLELAVAAEPAAPIPAPTPQRQARLVTNLAYRRAQLLVALDRAVAPLRSSTGRHRAEDMPRLYGTVAQRRHSAAEAQALAHLAWNTSTKDWPVLVLRAGWSVPEIPATVELGELVRS